MPSLNANTSAPLTVITLSGGMDSTVLAAHYAALGHRLIALSVNYGQRHLRELNAATLVAECYNAEHLIVDLRGVGLLLAGSALTDASVEVPEGHYAAPSMRATVVPNRNAILANIAVGLAVARGAGIVGLGVHAGDHAVYPDCRPEFIDALNTAVRIGNDGFSPPVVQAPFAAMSKTDIARHGAALVAPLGLTWSCYLGGAVHCGRCGTCVERAEAFHGAGLVDPTLYANTPVGA